MPTTESQIESIRQLALEMERSTLIRRVIVNDWGRFGNFDVHVYPTDPQSADNRKVQASVRKYIKEHLPAAHVRQIFAPDRVRVRYWNNKRERFMTKPGPRARDFWAVDIDFQEYDSETNTFI